VHVQNRKMDVKTVSKALWHEMTISINQELIKRKNKMDFI